MKFTLTTKIPESNFKLNHEHPITLMGSCFSQNIGNKLGYHKFKVNPNCFGTVFNPISIANNINRLINKTLYTTNDFYNYKNEKIVNFNTQFSSCDLKIESIIKKENSVLKKEIEHFKNSQTLIITIGTAWVYEFNETKKIVANCHKIPNTNFTKRLLSIDEIVAAYLPILEELKQHHIIFTVSPVRHSKDGLHENNLSKGTLLLAINQLTKEFKNCNYFPAYEIVIDELRDYRFFKDDLVHPTDLAVNYVWNKFSDCYFDEDTTILNEAILKVVQSVNHRPFDPKSEAHQKFTTAIKETIKHINKDFPFLDFSEELKTLV
jgi:hypothetical protein